MELTDQNFEAKIKNSEKPVLVDFFAEWCQPCYILGPILEKVVEDFKDKIIFAKVNLDTAPLTAQKYGIDRIPMVVLFKGGKPISGFVGVRPEPVVREILNKMLSGENTASQEGEDNKKEIDRVIKEYEEYAKKNGFKLNPNREIVERLIKGLLENEKKYGARYCPCRRVIGNQDEDRPKICPCVWHRAEIEKKGHCFCGLFVKM